MGLPMLEVHFTKRFVAAGENDFALQVSFSLGEGITVLFGPSGSGKTTTLHAIAGMLAPDQGRIALDGRVFFDSAAGQNLSIQERRAGFVFQDYLLFPHLTASANVAYGLRARSERHRRRRALELLEWAGIAYAAERRPRQLSGGEQQRVALARALASEPSILLLDEPFSAVDAQTRARLLDDIIEIQRRSAIPFLYVTHNPSDALRAAQTALILDGGKIVQEGNPAEVFNAPRSLAAARAVGAENVLTGRVIASDAAEGVSTVQAGGCRIVIPYVGLSSGARVTLGIPADDIILSREPVTRTSARNLLAGRVEHVLRDGGKAELIASCGVDLKVRLTAQAVELLELAPGTEVFLLIKANACRVLD
jgi:molybdate transport system ATP-binding protein